jgi:serine/threonine-protein kinase RsbW
MPAGKNEVEPDGVGRPQPGRSLIKSYAAVPATLPQIRASMTRFAREVGVDDEQLDYVRLAVSEAVSNVVKHAYPDGSGRIYLTAAVAGGDLWVLIADDGCGLRPGSGQAGLGVGLALIATASDDVSVVKRASGGTELRMRFVLDPDERARRRQARGSTASASAPASSRFSTIT